MANPTESFMIGAWWAPSISVARDTFIDNSAYRQYKALGFNTIVATSDLTDTSVHHDKSYNEYFLRRLADVGGLSAYIMDDSLHRQWWATDAVVDEVVTRYASIDASLRSRMLGYFYADEPWPYFADSANGVLVLNRLQADDPEKKVWIDLLANCTVHPNVSFFDQTKNELSDSMYQDYINLWGSPNKTMISFDNYGVRVSGGRELLVNKFYQNHKLVALASQRLRIPFYSFPQSTQFVSMDDNLNPKTVPYVMPADARINLSPARLRWEAFVPVIYGAKGIVWFTYLPVETNTTTQWRRPGAENFSITAIVDQANSPVSAVAPTISEINNGLLNIGTELMDMEWLETFHGSSVNNTPTWGGTLGTTSSSGENDLDIFDISKTLVDSITSSNKQDFMFGLFRSGAGYEYLMILNKNTGVSRSLSIRFKPDVDSVYDTAWTYSIRSNSTWNRLPNPKRLKSKSVLPGDMVIIKMTRRRLRKYSVSSM